MLYSDLFLYLCMNKQMKKIIPFYSKSYENIKAELLLVFLNFIAVAPFKFAVKTLMNLFLKLMILRFFSFNFCAFSGKHLKQFMFFFEGK